MSYTIWGSTSDAKSDIILVSDVPTKEGAERIVSNLNSLLRDIEETVGSPSAIAWAEED